MAADRLAGATQLNQRYRLLSELGQGGMARVYKAEDTRLGRIVAVKVLREQYAGDRVFLRKFQQEAQAAAAISHPNIVGVYDVGQDGGTHYIVMEYVEGVTLKDLIERQGPLGIDVTISLAEQICAGLQFAHGKGIVHRDVKPQNVIVTPDLRAKIADFGIARALDNPSVEEANEVFGTVHYISPEQARGQTATPSSDIYSMGVMLYEMLSGQLPFPGDNPAAVATKHLREEPRPLFELNPRVPPTLSQIVLEAMAKDPRQRFSSAARLGETLHGYLDFVEGRTGVIRKGKLVSPEKAAAAGPITEERRRGVDWLLVILGVFTLVLMLGLGALGAAVYRAYSVTPTPMVPTPGPLIMVPNLIGRDASMARLLVEGQNMTYQERGREFSETVELEHVILQVPEPRTQVEPGAVVGVVVSKGPSRVKVPPLKGLNPDEASAQLKAVGLSAEKVEEFEERVPQGFVFDQDPPSGSGVPAGSSVRIKVSKGARPTPVPTPRPVPSPTFPVDASGRVAVPPVVGMPEQDAKDQLLRVGLRLWPYGTNYQGHDQLPDELLKRACVGCVLSTNPPAGTRVALGTEVKIAVRKD